jgi:hypothetical protein
MVLQDPVYIDCGWSWHAPLPAPPPRLQERLSSGQGLPDYIKNHIIYYAGPAKTPDGYASGSFGPTTAGDHWGLLLSAACTSLCNLTN